MLTRTIAATLALAVAGTALAADDNVQGNWLGTWTGQGGMGGKNVCEVCGLGNGEYQATFTAYDSGEQDKGIFTFSINGSSVSDTKVVFTQKIDLGRLGMFSFDADVENGKLLGKYSNGNRYQGTMELKRVEKQHDSIGAKPLPGAVVLFDGKSLDQWRPLSEAMGEWTVSGGAIVAPASDSAVAPRGGHLASKATFGSAQIHIEFRVPYLPAKRGQERGQGGVFLQGRYELQIVDSFGFPRTKNSAGEYSDHEALGAIYRRYAPKELPALPPGEWQAFDITYTAAKLDAAGKVVQPAEATVVLNGTPIHEKVALDEPTDDAPLPDGKAGLVLQNAGQPVDYRNIWYVPLDGPAR
jgi:hypothetical protein